MSEETVKVLVRCRPLNAREKGLNCDVIVDMEPSVGQVSLRKPISEDPPKTFSFDGVYGMDSCTKQIYEDLVFPLVEGVLEGYNGTVFAYVRNGESKERERACKCMYVCMYIYVCLSVCLSVCMYVCIYVFICK